MSSKRKAPARGLYLVAEDYSTADLRGTVDDEGAPKHDGKGGVSWGAGAVVELSKEDADWVEADRPATLTDYAEAADAELDNTNGG